MQKRLFDVFLSLFLLFIFFPVLLLSWLVASFETRSNGFFLQRRVGRFGVIFTVIKIKTMFPPLGKAQHSSITIFGDSRVTVSGHFMRKFKIDELPQLLNVLLGTMSFVGPRPDVPGYLDQLEGHNRRLLSLRPGITGPASIKYRNEESLLSNHPDPVFYNDTVIWPDKVQINLEYLDNWSFVSDLKYLLITICPSSLL